MPGRPTVAIDATRRVKTEGERQFGVSGSTKDDRSIRPQPEAEDNGEWFKRHPPDALSTRRPPLHLHVSKMTQVGLLGGHHHHPAAFSPTRTNSEPLAPLKRPNMAMATPKRDRNEGNDEGKHLLGVLKGKDKQEVEGSRIVVEVQSKWYNNHSSDFAMPQDVSPPLLVPESTRITSLASIPTFWSASGIPPPSNHANCHESLRLHSGHPLALKLMHFDAFWHPSDPVLPIPNPRHGATVSPCPQDLPASKST